MSNLFVVCGGLTLTFSQCMVSSLLRNKENHIWLFTYDKFSQLHQSFERLLIPELWSTVWQVNFDAREEQLIRRELFYAPYKYHLLLSKSEHCGFSAKRLYLYIPTEGKCNSFALSPRYAMK